MEAELHNFLEKLKHEDQVSKSRGSFWECLKHERETAEALERLGLVKIEEWGDAVDIPGSFGVAVIYPDENSPG